MLDCVPDFYPLKIQVLSLQLENAISCCLFAVGKKKKKKKGSVLIYSNFTQPYGSVIILFGMYGDFKNIVV